MTSWRIIQGDCREALRTLDAGSIQTCVTSPPYFGLRDYGTAEWGGGDPMCDHLTPAAHGYNPHATSTLGPKRDGVSPTNSAHSDSVKRQQYREFCEKCGARRVDRQIGLEPTPDEFVAAMVDVFREVRRVLADDGTVWLNLGDSYAGSWGAQSRGATSVLADRSVSAQQIVAHPKGRTKTGSIPEGADYKAKDLLGIPWMVAFALRADGWYLRRDIIWHKPNPMPESITDRPTTAHEYLFLLSKAPRYFYDADAIAEPVEWGNHPRTVFDNGPQQTPPGTPPHRGLRRWPGIGAPTAGAREATSARGADEREEMEAKTTRNKRSVWTVTTAPYAGAHFATFPPKLIEPCILAGSREGDTVLDPFSGSGTTGMVALRHGRSYVGCELNPEYVELSRARITDDAPLFNTHSEVAA